MRKQLSGAPLSKKLPGSVHNRGQETGLEGLTQNIWALLQCCGETFKSDVWEREALSRMPRQSVVLQKQSWESQDLQLSEELMQKVGRSPNIRKQG